MPAPTTPETTPRVSGGKRSAITVVMAGCMELKATVAITHSTISDQKLVCHDTPNRHSEPISEAMAIQGERRPQRVRVRSDKAPAIGVVRVENTEVIANIRARLLAFWAGLSAAIWLGNSTPSTPL
jgi:hypothetical protein